MPGAVVQDLMCLLSLEEICFPFLFKNVGKQLTERHARYGAEGEMLVLKLLSSVNGNKKLLPTTPLPFMSSLPHFSLVFLGLWLGCRASRAATWVCPGLPRRTAPTHPYTPSSSPEPGPQRVLWNEQTSLFLPVVAPSHVFSAEPL